jgi:flagellar hook-associated protein 2
MVSQGLFSIGGIASGLDTAGMIEQLMAIERQPIVRMQNTQKQLRSVDSAWQSINTRLSALRSAVDAVSQADKFTSLIAVNSSSANVAVSKAATPGTGTLTFSVERLATAHQVGSGAFAATATQSLGATGRLEVAVGTGAAVGIDVTADDSLQTIAGKLNALKGGFTASVIKTAEGEHRMVFNGNATGAANSLSITTTTGLSAFMPTDGVNLDGLRTLQTAQDAMLKVGGTNAIELYRASNTVDDLVPGAVVNLRQAAPGEQITVSASRDTTAAVKAVKDYVNALNGAIKTVADLSAYNAETKTAGSLQGDSTARRLLSNLRQAAVAPIGVDLGTYSSPASVGIAVDRHGVVTLDETKLKAAFDDDFEAVARLFSPQATTTSASATAVGASTTRPGVYTVEVTEAATRARSVTGATFSPNTAAEPKTFRISSGGTHATVTIDTTNMSAAQVVAAINEALDTAKLTTVRAEETGGGTGIALQDTRFGSAPTYTVEAMMADGAGGYVVDPNGSVWGLETVVAGKDVVGRIKTGDATSSDPWVAMTGRGQQLSVPDGAAKGAIATWTGAGPGTFGIDVSRGLAGGLGDALALAEGKGGMIARARDGITNQIAVYQTRIDGFEQRLGMRETTLRRQFTAMETALSNMQAQGNWLTSQLSSLNGLSSQR